jgi:hypothetical protein
MNLHDFFTTCTHHTPALPPDLYARIEQKTVIAARRRRRLLYSAAVVCAGVGLLISQAIIQPFSGQQHSVRTATAPADTNSTRAVYSELSHVRSYFDSDSIAAELNTYSLLTYTLTP